MERIQKSIRMGEHTPMVVAYYAARCGIVYDGKGSIGGLLDVIASFRGDRLGSFTALVKDQCREVDGIESPKQVYPSSLFQAQPMRPIKAAPVGVPVLGVWLHVAGNDFCSCCLSGEGQWFDTSVGVDDIEGAMLTTPDGWLPLPVPVVTEENDGEAINS